MLIEKRQYENDEQPCVETDRVLDGLRGLKADVAGATEQIHQFLVRFRGVGPVSTTEKTPPPIGHEGRLRDLRAAVDSLAKAANQLDSIG